MEWFKKLLFLEDLVDGIKDIYEIIRDKEKRFLVKIIFIIISIGFVFLSYKIWL